MKDLEAQIQPRSDTPVNRDFAPIAYYFDVALWSRRFNRSYRQVFSLVAAVPFRSVAGATALRIFGAHRGVSLDTAQGHAIAVLRRLLRRRNRIHPHGS